MVVDVVHHLPLYLNVAPFDTSVMQEPPQDMNADYTTAEHWFGVQPNANEMWQIHWLRFVLDVSPDDALLQSRGYGTVDANLSSPIQVIFVESGKVVSEDTFLDLTVGTELDVRAHWHWARAGFSSMADFAYRNASPTPWDAMIFTMDVEKVFGAPILLRGSRGGQLIIKTGTNSFTAFFRHRMIVSGLRHSDPYTGTRLDLLVAPEEEEPPPDG